MITTISPSSVNISLIYVQSYILLHKKSVTLRISFVRYRDSHLQSQLLRNPRVQKFEVILVLVILVSKKKKKVIYTDTHKTKPSSTMPLFRYGLFFFFLIRVGEVRRVRETHVSFCLLSMWPSDMSPMSLVCFYGLISKQGQASFPPNVKEE